MINNKQLMFRDKFNIIYANIYIENYKKLFQEILGDMKDIFLN